MIKLIALWTCLLGALCHAELNETEYASPTADSIEVDPVSYLALQVEVLGVFCVIVLLHLSIVRILYMLMSRDAHSFLRSMELQLSTVQHTVL